MHLFKKYLYFIHFYWIRIGECEMFSFLYLALKEVELGYCIHVAVRRRLFRLSTLSHSFVAFLPRRPREAE